MVEFAFPDPGHSLLRSMESHLQGVDNAISVLPIPDLSGEAFFNLLPHVADQQQTYSHSWHNKLHAIFHQFSRFTNLSLCFVIQHLYTRKEDDTSFNYKRGLQNLTTVIFHHECQIQDRLKDRSYTFIRIQYNPVSSDPILTPTNLKTTM